MIIPTAPPRTASTLPSATAHMRLAAQRLAIGGPWGVPPVRGPHGQAHDQQRNGDADGVLQSPACTPMSGASASPEGSTSRAAPGPRRRADQRGEVRVQAADAGLAIGLLRACVPREAAADEDPGDAVNEELEASPARRALPARRCRRRPGCRLRALARQLVEDLAGAEERDADADRDRDEAFERAQRAG